MGFVKEFKEFAMRGNVIDMAVGIVIGAAFGKIVSSFVGDVIMPAIGVLTGGVDFSNLKLTLKEGSPAHDSAAAIPAVTLNYGMFINTIIDFLIVALAIFLAVKTMNRLKRKQQAVPPAPHSPPPAAPTKEQLLLTEIRDVLKARNQPI